MWNTLILNPMVNGLLWIYGLIGDFGIAIILFTILIRLITQPLTAQQMRSMQVMQEMQSSKEWQEEGGLPIIPEGAGVAGNATIHTHLTPDDEQQDGLIKGVPLALAQEDMRRLGFYHTPPCGSAESAIFLLMQARRSYILHGLPNKKEMRYVHLPGHGVLAWGYNGMRDLVRQFAYNIQFKPHVTRW